MRLGGVTAACFQGLHSSADVRQLGLLDLLHMEWFVGSNPTVSTRVQIAG